ncbi:MAG: TonB-dependent receptor [Corticimicrobacter sp.]|uniref:TonB-dependent siderophore receptor n=1 Tax=Corticimicrobacter sp. TaxID=2678536 RepID=UPI0032D9E84E
MPASPLVPRNSFIFKHTLNTTLLCLMAASIAPRISYAQGSSTPAMTDPAGTQVIDIGAGPLPTVLNLFAQTVDVSLSFDAALLAGQHSPGLQGRFDAATGFQRILQGSGFEAIPSGPSRWMLRALPDTTAASATDDNIAALDTVTIAGAYREGDAPNTGYTVTTTASATKLDLAPKETPQSITTFTAQQIQDQGLLTLSEVLDQTPGITLVTAGVAGAGSQPIYSRTFPVTSVQMDGVMASTYILSGSASGDIGMQDSFLYERIDVIRGSNSLTGGAGDASASLNFVRKHPYLDPHLSASLKYGSWNTRRAEVDYSTPLSDRLRIRLAAAAQEGDHWVDGVSSDRKALSLIGALDVTDNDRISLGVTHYDFKLNGASPHGITRYSEVYDYTDGSGLHAEETEAVDRNFNNATPWSRTHRKYTNLFASWEHTFDNDWLVKASFNYANNRDDKLYGEIGTTYYVPRADRASYSARRDNSENEVKAFDLHLKGSFELADRQQDFVVGANYYAVHRKLHWGYASEDTSQLDSGVLQVGAGPQHQSLCSDEAFANLNDQREIYRPYAELLWGSLEAFEADFNQQIQERTARCAHRSGISIDEWNANGDGKAPTVAGNGNDMFTRQITTHTRSRQTGVYFASHLRPFARTHLILGGRWAQDTHDDPYFSCAQNSTHRDYCTGDYDGRAATPPRLKPKFLPYAGLIYEITPQVNAYASYTTTYVRDINSATSKNWATGEWLPPVRSITYEGGLKSAFFDGQLNVAASYFKMEQKDFPYQTNNAATSGTIDNGWRVYGWEFNVAGAITPNWNMAAGYVRQKQLVPMNLGEVLASARDDFTASYRAPEKSFKLFTTYSFDKLMLGLGWRWQSSTQSAWIPTNKTQVEQEMMKQDAYHVFDLMARYQIDRNFSMQLNVNNVFDEVYYQHERSYISGAPRNAMLTLNYRM